MNNNNNNRLPEGKKSDAGAKADQQGTISDSEFAEGLLDRRKRSASASQTTDFSLNRSSSSISTTSKRRSRDGAAAKTSNKPIAHSSGLGQSGSVHQQERFGGALQTPPAAQELGSASTTGYQAAMGLTIDQLQQLQALQAMFQGQQQTTQQLQRDKEQELEVDRKLGASFRAQNLSSASMQQQILQRLLHAGTAGTIQQQGSSSNVAATYACPQAKTAPTNPLDHEFLQLLALVHQQPEQQATIQNSAISNDLQMLSMWLAQRQHQIQETNFGTQQLAAFPLQQQALPWKMQLLQVLHGLGLGPAVDTLPASIDPYMQVALASSTAAGLQQQNIQQLLQNLGAFAGYPLRQQQLPSLPPTASAFINTASTMSNNNNLVLNLLAMLQQPASGSSGVQQQSSPATTSPPSFTKQAAAGKTSTSSSARLNLVDGAASSGSATRTRKNQSLSAPPANWVERRVGHAVAYVPAFPPTTLPEKIGMHLPSDPVFLSEYQSEIRRQLEYFTSTSDDVNYSVQGRKRKAILGQVGIRCKHCAGFNLRQRGRGAVYYPTSLNAVYQAAQNMATNHLQEHCSRIPASVRYELGRLRDRRDTASGGKQYWADACKAVGLVEDEDCLRFSIMEESTNGSHESGEGV